MIRIRLTLSYVGIVLFILFSIYGYLDHSLKRPLDERVTSELRVQATLAREFLSEMLPDKFSHEIVDNLVDRLGGATSVRLSFIGLEGVVWGDTEQDDQGLKRLDNHQNRPEVQSALKDEVGIVDRYSNTVQAHLRYLALPVYRTTNQQHFQTSQSVEQLIGVCRVALPIKQVNIAMAGMRQSLLLASGSGVVIAIFFGIVLGGMITKPIRELNRITQSIANGEISSRVPISSDDEFGQLSQHFNQMADRIEAQIDEISQERDRLETILTTMVEGALLINAEFDITYANPAATEMLNLPNNSTPSAQIKGNPDLRALLRQARATRDVAFTEVNLEARETEITAVPVFDRTGPEVYKHREYVMVIHDVSQLRKLERVRADFVANVSHELRTPLTSIRGYAETLLSGALEDPNASQRFCAEILQQASQMAQLVSDLLDLSRIESGSVKLQLQPCELAEFRAYLVNLFDVAVEESGLTLEWQVSEALPPVLADKQFLEQVFVNLIDNAIKYTPTGGRITISAEIQDAEMIVHVKDTGIGIPEDTLERIFERFFRVDKARSREIGGTGLGLSIVKHILRQHGGRAWAESILGEGSIFHFAIPISQTEV